MKGPMLCYGLLWLCLFGVLIKALGKRGFLGWPVVVV